MKDILMTICSPENLSFFTRNFSNNVALSYIIKGTELIKSKAFVNYRGCILGVKEIYIDDKVNTAKIAHDIIFDYNKNGFKGIYLDFFSGKATELVFLLDKLCVKEGIELFVPITYAKSVNYAKLIFDTSISGGNLKNILEYMIFEYGQERFCAKISHVVKKCYIPSNGEGEVILEDCEKADNVFFSDNLYIKYYSYMQDERCVFTTFDDIDTLNRKISLLRGLAVEKIFICENCIKKFKILS